MTTLFGNDVNCQEIACADEDPHPHGDKCRNGCPCKN